MAILFGEHDDYYTYNTHITSYNTSIAHWDCWCFWWGWLTQPKTRSVWQGWEWNKRVQYWHSGLAIGPEDIYHSGCNIYQIYIEYLWILMNTYSTNVSTKTPRKYRRTQKNVPRLTTNDRWKSRCPTDGFMPQGCTTTPTPPFVCQLPWCTRTVWPNLRERCCAGNQVMTWDWRSTTYDAQKKNVRDVL